ncbi:EI24 domain-containing protein [Indioceanicola profundi]|uniref:EI24 domain-containing protein n=1 Tax=Indioceanicola profundi TaxID=2220096 RepID=UPI00384D5BBB
MRSILSALFLFLVLLAACAWLISHTAIFETSWMEWAADILGGLAAVALAWVMFPAVVLTISSFMLDGVVHAVERRWYPGLGPARDQTTLEALWNAAKFFLLVLVLNLLVLPLYLIPVAGQLAYYSVNGYLLGREYYELVAARRLDPDRMRYLRSEGSLGLFVAGVIIAFLSTLPIVNLLIPVVAAAFMVHIFEDMRRGLPPPGAA